MTALQHSFRPRYGRGGGVHAPKTTWIPERGYRELLTQQARPGTPLTRRAEMRDAYTFPLRAGGDHSGISTSPRALPVVWRLTSFHPRWHWSQRKLVGPRLSRSEESVIEIDWQNGQTRRGLGMRSPR